jgi:Helix-turn-helix domain
MAERVAVRDISNEEGNKLLSIIRRGSGSVVRWRRAQIVLWSAQHMDVPAIAKIAFTSEDRVREVIHNFNRDGFDSLAPKYAGGRPPKFSAAERAEVKKIALGRAALLLSRRHRPPEPRGSGLLDSALHRLAEPQCAEQSTT